MLEPVVVFEYNNLPLNQMASTSHWEEETLDLPPADLITTEQEKETGG